MPNSSAIFTAFSASTSANEVIRPLVFALFAVASMMTSVFLSLRGSNVHFNIKHEDNDLNLNKNAFGGEYDNNIFNHLVLAKTRRYPECSFSIA